MKLYRINVKANNFPAGGNYLYDNLPMAILREDGRNFGPEAGYLSKELFTLSEVEDVKNHLLNFVYVYDFLIQEVELPVDPQMMAVDFGGYGGSWGGYCFYKDDQWKGLKVMGYYDREGVLPSWAMTKFYFDTNGGLEIGNIELTADETKELFLKYIESVTEKKSATYIQKTRLEHKVAPEPTYNNSVVPF